MKDPKCLPKSTLSLDIASYSVTGTINTRASWLCNTGSTVPRNLLLKIYYEQFRNASGLLCIGSISEDQQVNTILYCLGEESDNVLTPQAIYRYVDTDDIRKLKVSLETLILQSSYNQTKYVPAEACMPDFWVWLKLPIVLMSIAPKSSLLVILSN